jgi:hypothetical protein
MMFTSSHSSTPSAQAHCAVVSQPMQQASLQASVPARFASRARADGAFSIRAVTNLGCMQSQHGLAESSKQEQMLQ